MVKCQCVARPDDKDPERLALWKTVFPHDGKVPIIGGMPISAFKGQAIELSYLIDFDRMSNEQRALLIHEMAIKFHMTEADLAADVAANGALIKADTITVDWCPIHEPKKEVIETMSKVLRTQTRSLPCKLTDDEVRNAGGELAAVVQDIAAEEERQTDVKAQMKARLTELQSRQTQLAIKVSRREEFREAKVEYEINDGADIVTERRLDTGEVMTIRPARDDEHQLALGGETEELFPKD